MGRNHAALFLSSYPRGYFRALTQRKLLDLACRGLWQRPKQDGAGRFETCEMLAAEGDDFLRGGGRVGL
jgi:hypothetical protein